ncbi:MAG: dUTPase, partial [Firmicutes bacterium]|nr:dUTPase [Bacillota bacterium]
MNRKLEIMFDMQDKLNGFIRESRGLDYSPEQWIQKQILAMLSELAELLDEVNFKWWKNPKPVDSAAVKEELVDVFHFFLSMCLSAGMTADELFDIYLSKNKENFK